MAPPITDPDVLAERMNRYLSEIVPGIIAEHGVMIQGVMPTLDDPGYPFAYTVGLHLLDAPEALLCGIGREGSHAILNDLHRMVKEGLVLEPGVVIEGLFAVYPAMVCALNGREEMGVARQLFPDCRTVQLVYPDKGHRWPWEEGYGLPDDAQKTWWVKPETAG